MIKITSVHFQIYTQIFNVMVLQKKRLRIRFYLKHIFIIRSIHVQRITGCTPYP